MNDLLWECCLALTIVWLLSQQRRLVCSSVRSPGTQSAVAWGNSRSSSRWAATVSCYSSPHLQVANPRQPLPLCLRECSHCLSVFFLSVFDCLPVGYICLCHWPSVSCVSVSLTPCPSAHVPVLIKRFLLFLILVLPLSSLWTVIGYYYCLISPHYDWFKTVYNLCLICPAYNLLWRSPQSSHRSIISWRTAAATVESSRSSATGQRNHPQYSTSRCTRRICHALQ